jgi:putative resolvase
MADRMVGMREAKAMLGVTSRTLRRCTASGRLPDRRSPGGQRIFSVAELEAILHREGTAPVSEGAGAVVLSARVSPRRQAEEGELDRQLARLREAAEGRVVAGEFADVASGLSDHARDSGEPSGRARIPRSPSSG